MGIKFHKKKKKLNTKSTTGKKQKNAFGFGVFFKFLLGVVNVSMLLKSFKSHPMPCIWCGNCFHVCHCHCRFDIDIDTSLGPGAAQKRTKEAEAVDPHLGIPQTELFDIFQATRKQIIGVFVFPLFVCIFLKGCLVEPARVF
jgi:hypothetical protein